MERLVSVAAGALGPVLDKLATLLKSDEHNRVRQLAARHRRTIEFIKLNLQDMHSLLLRMWDREDLDAVCKEWMVDARELSYDMEDDIDDYFIKDQSYDRSGRRLKNLLRNLKIRVEEVSSRFREQWIIAPGEDEATSNRCNKRSVDPRAGFLHKDASELVGMEKPKEDIVKLLQDHAMVCIHGSAGMGKTTLADLVYQSIGDGFQCRAFVTVSKSPDMLEVLGAILRQVTDGVQPTGRSTEAATVQNLINDIANFLSGKRYETYSPSPF